MHADERVIRLFEEIRDLRRETLESWRTGRAERAAALDASREDAERRQRELEEEVARHATGMRERSSGAARGVTEGYEHALAAARLEHTEALQALRAERRRQSMWSMALALVLLVDVLVTLY